MDGLHKAVVKNEIFKHNLTEDAKMYTAKYKIIYKRVITAAKWRENDKNILHANFKSKAVWQIINKKTGRTSSDKQILK
jgi:hypothetical protein